MSARQTTNRPSGPRFTSLLVDMTEKLDEGKYQLIASAARAHIRRLGGGVSAIGELVAYATRDEQDIIDPALGERLGWFLRAVGEEIDELIDVFAEAVSEGAKP